MSHHHVRATDLVWQHQAESGSLVHGFEFGYVIPTTTEAVEELEAAIVLWGSIDGTKS